MAETKFPQKKKASKKGTPDEEIVRLITTPSYKVEGEDACDNCYHDIQAAASSCYNDPNWAECIIDKIQKSSDCINCLCDFLGVECTKDLNKDVMKTCLDCGLDFEKVISKCIGTNGAKEITKCFIESIPELEPCVDCICGILEYVGINCQEIKLENRNFIFSGVPDSDLNRDGIGMA